MNSAAYGSPGLPNDTRDLSNLHRGEIPKTPSQSFRSEEAFQIKRLHQPPASPVPIESDSDEEHLNAPKCHFHIYINRTCV